jgi:hypothetical protein
MITIMSALIDPWVAVLPLNLNLKERPTGEFEVISAHSPLKRTKDLG